jgi:hypothetical protein
MTTVVIDRAGFIRSIHRFGRIIPRPILGRLYLARWPVARAGGSRAMSASGRRCSTGASFQSVTGLREAS